MNGFSYDPDQKKITITDNNSIVIWHDVKQDVADKAGKMWHNGEVIDNYLIQNGCKRYWGNG